MKGLRTDKTTSLALDQLEHGGVIQLGRFKREPRMHISDGLLSKGQRFVVHFMLRNEILALNHNESHPGVKNPLGKTRTHF